MKERLIVQKLIDDFIEKDNVPAIALLIGIRRVGKTTVLKQISCKYKNSLYIELAPRTDDINNIIDLAIDKNIKLLLLDEITHLIGYDILAEHIYNMLSEHGIKAVITGSSPYHLNELSYRKLGGGRSIIYNLPPITFTEYCYFTEKINSYNDDNINNNYFLDYLMLKDLEDGLKVRLDNNYFNGWSEINYESNENAELAISSNKITEQNLIDVFNLVSYNLINITNNTTLVKPKIGGKEHIHLRQNNIKYKLSSIDLTNLILTEASNRATTLSAIELARVFLFLIDSGLAITSILKEDLTLMDIRIALRKCKTKNDLDDILDYTVIMLTSPLFYIPLGEEILSRFNCGLEILEKGYLTGMLLEVYFSGMIYMTSNKTFLDIYKLSNEIGEEEVDIYLPNKMLLLESTISDKKEKDIFLTKYFIDKDFIRICSSKTKEYKNNFYHVVPYGKLMYLIDTGKIFKLMKSSLLNQLK